MIQGSNPTTPPKFNSWPLKNNGWKMNFLFEEGNSSGAMLNFRGVMVPKYTTAIQMKEGNIS